jgi:hypothetical protein
MRTDVKKRGEPPHLGVGGVEGSRDADRRGRARRGRAEDFMLCDIS